MQLLFYLLLLLAFLFLTGCTASGDSKPQSTFNTNSQPVSHALFTSLLQKYVDEHGRVNYRGLLQDSASLNQYLQLLSQNPPGPNWTTNEKLAYWINAYNGFTLKLVLRHYPVKSIKNIGNKLAIPFVNTVWDISFIKIGDKSFTLNKIEHGILRKDFTEPRIHFAIVCASQSCPKLRREAYTAANIDTQLNNQAEIFINDPFRNKIQTNQVQISKIFSWFKGDFTREKSLIAYLNQYSTIKINPDARVSSLPYNWNLNE
ncbi:DUF547 domain-containing protein [Adhaeribacter swui]|uniref:DUF547 domain-containing protein n=1 Tax=Adhaeribacter swui TaxID=2086471 RepID=A0A7G7GD98_9BACT|nr:DUF547 domain-containing protein [Adhaeribacter swui]QNF35132.1 DUF547 domain-containing protein [Adhaeribacter swui]